MANSVSLKLTNYGLRKVMTNGAEQSFKYFSLSDMNEIYYVSTNPNLSDIMNITGSKNLFTARKSCIDASPTLAQVTPPPMEELLKTAKRWVVNYYKEDCGVNDFTKSNLTVTVNLHEYFTWLSDVASYSAYTENLDLSIMLFQGVYVNKQEQNFVDNTWYNIDTTNKFVASYEFASEQDKANYLSFNSKHVEFNGVQRQQIDKSFDRFYTSLLLGFGANIEGNTYLEGHNSFVTFNVPQFGYVVNGYTNFIPLNKMVDPKLYKEIRPAVYLSSLRTDDIFYLKDSRSYNTTDLNRFMGQAVWGFQNQKGQSLVQGMIEKAKNHIEFYFKETSFDKWELPINLRLLINDPENLPIVGGNISYNFVYEPNATLLGYNNILIIN
jgi:hypothetical protein